LTNGSVANSLPFNIYVSLPQPWRGDLESFLGNHCCASISC
jgi:hypothetical protein